MKNEVLPLAEAMREHLLSLKRWRGEDRDPESGARIREVKRWQAERLTRTYADLASEPRYRSATAFFLEDLYGPKDFSDRDAAMLRILPVMTRVLPAKAVETAALSIEVEALSEELDHRLAAALGSAPLTEQSYAQAYRQSASREERLRQIALIVEVGHRLDGLVGWPFVSQTLKLMRTPARLAGLSDLQDVLERGFEAFRRMAGADEFLAVIESRERAILERLFNEERPYFDPPA